MLVSETTVTHHSHHHSFTWGNDLVGGQSCTSREVSLIGGGGRVVPDWWGPYAQMLCGCPWRGSGDFLGVLGTKELRSGLWRVRQISLG